MGNEQTGKAQVPHLSCPVGDLWHRAEILLEGVDKGSGMHPCQVGRGGGGGIQGYVPQNVYT